MNMQNHPRQSLRRALGSRATSLASIACLSLLAASVNVQAQVVTESPEVVYSGVDAERLRDKATQLGTAVAIYEYVHNTIEYSPYHGSRSGSVNTFLGQRGSDVDIATALIAMLRYKNIPARYAVGTVRIPATQLTNWLGIPQLDTAVQVLKDQGIQGVTLAADRSTVDFEHAWAEAFVPFDQYRGINTVSPAVDCSQAGNASRCTWVALDGSFKQKTYNGLNLDPYDAITFDYTAYYNAIKNNDATRRDKNPLTILEDQIGAWLRTNYAGKTLEDVEDSGLITPLREGLLPASLPYQVIGNVRRYDSIAAHDAVVPSAEPKIWGKTLRVTVTYTSTLAGGGSITLSSSTPNVLLAEVSTKRLTFAPEFAASSSSFPSMVFRLGGTEIARPIQGGSSQGEVPLGSIVTMVLNMSGAPSVTAGVSDRDISSTYTGIVGGYYLIATGGESSNWSQVHRAADQLLASNNQYQIVFNLSEPGCLVDGINCTPYVDSNGNGWDASDTKLILNKTALDDLTGGLLYVGATHYYAKLREKFERADRLMKTKTPVLGFLGVVSSEYEAEYIDGTAFSILPGGLLIDMKGIAVSGSYRTNESTVTYSNRQFEFLSHIVSSLEHEIWQELTGYDAVSTVRGLQMALGRGADLLSVKRDATSNTVPEFLYAAGFSSAAPIEFTPSSRDVYGTRLYSWTHPQVSSNVGFDAIKKSPASSEDARIAVLQYVNDYTGEDIKCFDDLENSFKNFIASLPPPRRGGGECVPVLRGDCESPPPLRFPQPKFCFDYGIGTFPTTSQPVDVTQADEINKRGFLNLLATAPQFFKYLDGLQGFVNTDFVYRSHAAAINSYTAFSVVEIRDDLLLRDLTKSWVEYILPSRSVIGCRYRFEVAIRKEYATATGKLLSMDFDIANRGASHSDVSECQ